MVFSTLVYTAQLLSAIGKLYAAFSVHEKHQTYERRFLDEAIFLLEECLAVLLDNESMIRNSCKKASKSLNGPEGNVAAKIIDSVALMKWGLERLRHNMTPWNYTATMPKVADAPLVLSSDEDSQAIENEHGDVVAYNIPEEYDSESNEDVMNTIPDISIDEDAGEVGTETNFLMGTTSSFGKAVRFNRHLVF